jgi:hypothetical protein
MQSNNRIEWVVVVSRPGRFPKSEIIFQRNFIFANEI